MQKIVFIVANWAKNENTGWETGFWLSELAQPYNEFTNKGYEIVIASPKGGKVMFDAMSDPENPHARTADLVSTGFKHHPKTKDLLENTVALKEIKEEDFDCIFVVGGLSPMLTFADNEPLKKLFTQFYEAGKASATICHGSVILLSATTSKGDLLVAGKKWTGFSDAEEDVIDKTAGKKVQPFRIETAAKKAGLNYVSGDAFAPYAVVDGNLITGQQGSSGAITAKKVIEFLESNIK